MTDELNNIELAKQALEFVEGCEVKAYAELDNDPSHQEGMNRFRCFPCQEWCYEDLRCDCCDGLDRGVARTLIPELAKRLLEAEEQLTTAYFLGKLDQKKLGDG